MTSAPLCSAKSNCNLFLLYDNSEVINLYIEDMAYNQVVCCHGNTVKPVNKGHPRERKNFVFIDKLSLLGGFFVSFDQ